MSSRSSSPSGRPAAGRVAVPPRGDGRRRGRHGRPRRLPRHPVRGPGRRGRQGRQQGHGQPPGVARGQGPVAEDAHLRRQRQPDRLALRPEPHQRRRCGSISRPMVKAIVAIEDYRFYDHGALDLKGTVRAFVTNQANGGSVQGGSSITQQMVKQTLLYQAETDEERKAATEETYARKIRELRYAIAFEKNHTKDWILERYLNIAYFGDGAFGVQSAARHFFSKNAKDLNLLESATLAGLVKNPVGYDPVDNPERAESRRNVVLDRMAQLGDPDREEGRAAQGQAAGEDARHRDVAQRLPAVAGAVLLRLRRQLAAQGPGARRHAQGASPHAQQRRPDDQHHDRPRHAEGRRRLGRLPRLPDRPGHRRPGDGRARHRRRPRARPVPPDGQGQEGRGDLPQLHRPEEVRRRQRLPGRLDVQGCSSSPPPSTRASR